MQHVHLGRSGLNVSRLCLGTAFRSSLFKPQIDEAATVRVIHQAIDAGINFIDCANFYSYGRSEEIVGRAIKGRRDDLVVATKFASPVRDHPGPNDRGASRFHLLREVERSLKRMQCGHLDVYWLHTPDDTTPIDETLRALDDLVHSGRVRYIGCSNLKAWQVCEALWQSDELNLHAFCAIQNQYSLLNRWEIEPELLPVCQKFGLGIVTYSPLAIGLLSGAFRHGQIPLPGTPWADSPHHTALFERVMTPKADAIVQALIEISATQGCTPAQVAMAWILAKPFVSSVIIGPDTAAQLHEVIGAERVVLSIEHIVQLDTLSAPEQPIKVA